MCFFQYYTIYFTDHLVILGNHRDAWTFGAVDPNSGTATLMEIARILADMKGKGNQLI